jgi:hypothetical protein
MHENSDFAYGVNCTLLGAVLYVLLIVVCPFVLLPLAIVFSVLLRYTDSDCPFGIFKLYLTHFIDNPYNTGEMIQQ